MAKEQTPPRVAQAKAAADPEHASVEGGLASSTGTPSPAGAGGGPQLHEGGMPNPIKLAFPRRLPFKRTY